MRQQAEEHCWVCPGEEIGEVQHMQEDDEAAVEEKYWDPAQGRQGEEHCWLETDLL